MLHSSMHFCLPEPSGVPSPVWQEPSRGPLPRLDTCILWACLLLGAVPSAARSEVQIFHLQGVESTDFTGRRSMNFPIDLGSSVARVNSARVMIAGSLTGGRLIQDCDDYGIWETSCRALVNVCFPPNHPSYVYDPGVAGGPHAMLQPFGDQPLVSDLANPWECLAGGVSTLYVRVEACWTPPWAMCSFKMVTPSILSITDAYLTIDFDALVPTNEESWGHLKGRYR
jgi:hypothetical protein